MTEKLGTTGLVLNEKLLWEKGAPGRCGMSIPESDVDAAPLDEALVGEGPDFPDLSEVDVARHYTRLSTWNFGVDTGMYPLGMGKMCQPGRPPVRSSIWTAADMARFPTGSNQGPRSEEY